MKLGECTFEIKTKSGEYRPCLVADTKGLFHIWTSDGKGIIEFDDGTVSKVEAEDIRFLDTESLMVENACFSDEWIERFKSEKKSNIENPCCGCFYKNYSSKIDQFAEELTRIGNEHGFIVYCFNERMGDNYSIVFDKGICITQYIRLEEIARHDNPVELARTFFNTVFGKEVE